jgi:monovalent cation:H+ antiporter-2, CPA2 family
VTFADAAAAVRVLSHIHALNPTVPVVVRARDESDIERFTAAGATEVVPEAFESGVMLASHTLVLIGVPLSRVMRRVAEVRSQQYGLLRGLFHGASEDEEGDGERRARLHSVRLDPQAHGVGRTLAELDLGMLEVQVQAVRRPGAKKKLSPAEAGTLQAADVVVLLGVPETLAAAEERLLKG